MLHVRIHMLLCSFTSSKKPMPIPTTHCIYILNLYIFTTATHNFMTQVCFNTKKIMSFVVLYDLHSGSFGINRSVSTKFIINLYTSTFNVDHSSVYYFFKIHFQILNSPFMLQFIIKFSSSFKVYIFD